jgi:hypothetical protein
MSRILGQVIHHGYVYPDFDAAVERFAAGGIGPFFAMHETAAKCSGTRNAMPWSIR